MLAGDPAFCDAGRGLTHATDLRFAVPCPKASTNILVLGEEEDPNDVRAGQELHRFELCDEHFALVQQMTGNALQRVWNDPQS